MEPVNWEDESGEKIHPVDSRNCDNPTKKKRTRGKWPFRLASDRATVEVLYGLNNGIKLEVI